MEAYVPWQPQLTWLNKHKSIAMNFRTGPPPSSLHRQTTKCFCSCCCSCSHICFYTSCCCCSLCCCYRNCYGCALCCCCCLTSVLVWWALLYLKLTGGAAPSKQFESHIRTVWQSHWATVWHGVKNRWNELVIYTCINTIIVDIVQAVLEPSLSTVRHSLRSTLCNKHSWRNCDRIPHKTIA